MEDNKLEPIDLSDFEEDEVTTQVETENTTDEVTTQVETEEDNTQANINLETFAPTTPTEQVEITQESTNKYDLNSVSSGVKYLADGYCEYAQEVITDRAVANIYDGLKPVHRRILATLHKHNIRANFSKSATTAGDVLHFHPHGDSSVYSAMVLMTDKNGSLAFPLLAGKGNFGGVYKTDTPAASRYTSVKLHKWTDEYFKELNGIRMVPNYDSTDEEPELLPVSFPAVLVNASSGIAVGFKSNIPSFNFNDVCSLVQEYIKDGRCSTVIAPDFVTGGYYIKDTKELRKLMETGTGKIKLRGKAVIKDKQIIVSEVPYGKTIQGIVRQVNEKDFNSIRNAYNADDLKHGIMFKVNCTAKSRTEEALYCLYKDTDFEYTYSADITVVKDGVPMQLGVWEIIQLWTDWRKKIIEKELSCKLQRLKESIREANAFMVLINSDKKDAFLQTVSKEGKTAGQNFIRENFTREEIPEDLIDFVSTRSLPTYHNGGKFAGLVLSAQANILNVELSLKDLGKVIYDEMDRLKNTYGKELSRRTKISKEKTFDDSIADSVATSNEAGTPVYFAIKNGFLRKCKSEIVDNQAERIFKGKSNDTLIGFDSKGRLLRVYCKDIKFNTPSEMGTFLPRYLGIDDTDNFKLMWLGRLQGDELMLLYKDGNIGFVNLHEWDDSGRHVKVLERGIAVSIADKLGAVVENIPAYLVVTTKDGEIGVTKTSEIQRKSRTAKTRVFNPKKATYIDTYAGYDEEIGSSILEDMEKYTNKLKSLKNKSEFKGSEADFIAMF